MVCVALGLGAVLFPLKVRLPRGVLAVVAAAPVLAGLALIGATTSWAAGVVLLGAFTVGLWYLVRASRDHDFLGEQAEEIREEATKPTRWWWPVLLTLVGLTVLTGGAVVLVQSPPIHSQNLGWSARPTHVPSAPTYLDEPNLSVAITHYAQDQIGKHAGHTRNEVCIEPGMLHKQDETLVCICRRATLMNKKAIVPAPI